MLEIVDSLSEYDMSVLDGFVLLHDTPATVWNVCESKSIPRFVGGDVMRRLVGLGLITTIYAKKPVWERKAVTTEKGRAISAFYNSEEFLDAN